MSTWTAGAYSRPLAYFLQLSWTIESMRITYFRRGLTAPRRAGHRSSPAVKVIFPRPSVRRGLSASEEHAVVFGAELCEVGVRLRRVGFEVEAVPAFFLRAGRSANLGLPLQS